MIFSNIFRTVKASVSIFPFPLIPVFILLGSITICPKPLFSQNGNVKPEYIVKIVQDKDTEEVISGASVFGIKNGKKVLPRIYASDSSGYVYFEDLWTYDTILVNALGYKDRVFPEWQPYGILRLIPQGFSLKNDVIISAAFTDYLLGKSTSATGTILQTALLRDGGLTIQSSLNRVPGIYMHSGALNTNRITIRGIGSRTPFSTNKVRAFWNDIPLSSGEGETTIEDLDVSQFDKVEVIRGPTSSRYGAGLGGAIRISSKSYGEGISLRSKFTAGSFGRKQFVSNANIDADKHHWFVGFNKLHSEGFRENNAYDRQSGTVAGRIIHHTSYDNPYGELSFLLNFSSLKAFIPSSLDSITFEKTPTQAAPNWGGVKGFEQNDKAIWGMTYQYRFSKVWKGKATVFSHFRDAYELRPFGILTETDLTTGIRSNLEWAPKGPFTVNFGGEYFYEWYNWQTFEQVNRALGPQQSNQQEKRRFYNLYGRLAYYFWMGGDNLTLEADLNLNNTQYTLADRFPLDSIDQSGNYRFSPILSPRIAVFFPIFNGHLKLRALISHGFSPPSVSETLTPDGLVNPNIQPEQGWNFEIGSRGGFWNGRVQTDFTLFYMAIQDLLVARRTSVDAFVGINAGATRHQGMEMSYSLDLSSKRRKIAIKTHGSLTLADYRFQDFVDDGQDFSGKKLPGTPDRQFSTGLDIGISPRPIGKLELNLTYEHVGAMYLQDANTIQSSPYNLAHAKLTYSKSFQTGKLNWELNAEGGLQNVFDARYASMIQINARSFGGRAPRYYYPGRPRNWFWGIQINLEI